MSCELVLLSMQFSFKEMCIIIHVCTHVYYAIWTCVTVLYRIKNMMLRGRGRLRGHRNIYCYAVFSSNNFHFHISSIYTATTMKIWTSILVLMIITLTVSADEVIIYINSSSPLASNTTSCGKATTPCYTFDLGLDVAQEKLMETHQLSITLMISQGEQYKHTSMTNGVFNEVNGLSIIGEVDNNGKILTTISCQGKVGFSFIKTFTIKISGIIFDKCGQLQNSTSYNYNKNNKGFLTFYVGLYFLYCRDVNLTFVTVSCTPGTGIVFYNIGGNNIIENSAFFRNIVENDKDIEVGGGGGGVYIEYSYCVPGEGGIECLEGKQSPNVNTQYTTQSTFFIRSSKFIENVANISNFANNTFIMPRKQYHSAFGRGGGLSVFFKGDASYNTITVDNCHITHNQALWGAGSFAEFQDNTNNNNISIRSSVIHNNNVSYIDVINEGTGGGGARVGFVFFNGSVVYSNNVTFFNSTLEGNIAYYGGGLSFYSARQPNVDSSSTDQLNTLKLQECHFMNNLGRIGAALDISLWHPSISGKHPRVFIDSCTFEGNNAMYQPQPSGLIGVGAVYVDSLPVMFSGNNSFNSNSGSALAVTGSYITIEPSSNVSFYNNSGRHGGAIALLGNTFILTNEDSVLHFVNNSAYYKGGAIYHYSSGERDLLSSRNCFIRYYDITVHPENWTSSFYFEGNTIEYMIGNNKKNNSIYTSTLLPCIWGGAFGNSDYNMHEVNKTFCWNNKWKYKVHHDVYTSCTRQISSAPSYYQSIEANYTTVPGKTIKLNLTVFDDLKHNVTKTSIFIARIIEGSATFRGEKHFKFTYISHEYLDLHGKPNSTIKLQIETLDPIVIRQNITVKFDTCPPGFIPPNRTDDDSIFSCQCYDISAYKSLLLCNEDNYTSKLLRTAWMGYNSTTEPKQFVVGETPYLSLGARDHHITLLNGSEQYLNDLFCKSTNRRGILCGQCQDGYGVAVNSDNYHCVKCTDKEEQYSWVFYVIASYLPTTIFFAIIFIFSMTVTFGPLNSFLFFAQVITTTVKVDADGTIPLQILTNPVQYKVLKSLYVIPYDIWNLNFFRPYLGQFCLNSKLDTLDIMSLSYIEAFYPLILLVLFVIIMTLYNKGVPAIVCLCRPIHRCLARFRQWSKLQQSFTGGMAAFIIISYTKFTLVSLLLLTPMYLYDYSGKSVSQVHYYDGTVSFPSYKHIVPAIVILATFSLILPLILAYPTFLRFIEYISCGRLDFELFYPKLKLQAFLDEFHGCYKDGTNGGVDCRWFASLYFVFRFCLFVIYTVAGWKLLYLLQVLMFLVAAFLFAVLRPYKRDWVNNVDVTIFLVLAAISCFSLYNLVLLELWVFTVQYILIFIPLLYFIGYYLVLFCSKFKSYHNALCSQNRRIHAERPQQHHEFETDHAALVDSTYVPNFLDFVDDTRKHGHHIRLSSSYCWQPSLSNRSSSEVSYGSVGSKKPSLLISDSSQLENTYEKCNTADRGDFNSRNAITDSPLCPNKEYHTAHTTNSSQAGYGTTGSTLVSLMPPL